MLWVCEQTTSPLSPLVYEMTCTSWSCKPPPSFQKLGHAEMWALEDPLVGDSLNPGLPSPGGRPLLSLPFWLILQTQLMSLPPLPPPGSL